MDGDDDGRYSAGLDKSDEDKVSDFWMNAMSVAAEASTAVSSGEHDKDVAEKVNNALMAKRFEKRIARKWR